MIREQALVPLISKLLQKKDYAGAQELLDSMSDPSPLDKKQIQSNILIAQGNLGQAAQMVEEKLLSAMWQISSCILPVKIGFSA